MTEMTRESMEYDVVIVGAGPAGLSAAIRLKQLDPDLNVVVLEKGSEVGAHILSGAVLDTSGLDTLIPDWKDRGAPITVEVKKDNFYVLGPSGQMRIPNWPMPPLMSNHGKYIVSMGNVCRWMAEQAEGLGVEIFPGMSCSELVYGENGEVKGVVAGVMGVNPDGTPGPNYEPGMELHGKYVFLSEGVRGSLAKEVIAKYDLSKGHCPQKFGIGMKEIWEIDPAKHREGTVTHTMGWPLGSNAGGGSFVYHFENNQVLIGFVVPPKTIAGLFNLQGLAFMGLYLLGVVAALLSALVFKWILKSRENSFLMLELPEYRTPVMRNVFLTVWEKVRSFMWEAGRIIMAISIVLWVLASYGPRADMQAARQEALVQAKERQLDETATANLLAARQIEASFAGHIGKFIEPAIRPLGFDWKIGIALVTSFAAREVFVGTMATIYSIGSAEDDYSVRDRMAMERDPLTGRPVYSLAASLSLLIFYVFAMQCMSTLAVVRRETKSWKWPLVQFLFMSGLAYLGSLITYQLLA